MASLSLSCKNHRFKTANMKKFIRNFNAETLAITFMSVSVLRFDSGLKLINTQSTVVFVPMPTSSKNFTTIPL